MVITFSPPTLMVKKIKKALTLLHTREGVIRAFMYKLKKSINAIIVEPTVNLLSPHDNICSQPSVHRMTYDRHL
jgi:hypothetical protein